MSDTSFRQSVINAYLDYMNNYLTIGVFAEHNLLTIPQANTLIKLGRELHENGITLDS